MNEDSVVVPTAEANASGVLVLDTGFCFWVVLTFDEVLLEIKDLILGIRLVSIVSLTIYS